MIKYSSIIVADIKNIRRDPTLLLILFAPFLILIFINYGIPALVPFIKILPQYFSPLVMFLSLLAGVLPGFIIAFILLDEKDMGLYDAFKVSPLQLKGLFMSRIILIISVGFLSSMLLLQFNYLVKFQVIKSIELAILCALNAPILIMLITTFAKNKVEGLTYLKAATITLIIPVVVLFTHSNWENLLSFFPAYWVFKLSDIAENFHLFFLSGFAVLFTINWLCLKWVSNKI